MRPLRLFFLFFHLQQAARSNTTSGQEQAKKKKMGRLEIDPFLSQLAALFKKTRNTGSVFVTMKKVSVTQTPRRRKNKEAQTERPEDCCLIRAQGPAGVKFSTIVSTSCLPHSSPFVVLSLTFSSSTSQYQDPYKGRGQVPGVVQQHAQGLYRWTQGTCNHNQEEGHQESLSRTSLLQLFFPSLANFFFLLSSSASSRWGHCSS